VKVEVKEIEKLIRELSVEIPADIVNEELEKAFADLRQKTTIKGFRKGKAPIHLVKSMYGDEVKVDVAEELIRTSYPKAIEEKKLDVVSPPKFTAFNFSDDGGLRYTAKVEVHPDIDQVDLDNLQVTAVDIEVKDEHVEELTQSLRSMFADFRPVDRVARQDDLVVVDLKKVYDPGLVLKTDLMPDVEIDLARGFTVKQFKEQLPGMKAGDEKEIEVVYDDDYPDRAYAGALIRYACKVKEVRERILPELNDAFAKRTGQAHTALELKMKIREDLKKRYAGELRSLQKGQIIRQICEQNPFPIPQSIVEGYLDSIVENEKEGQSDVDESKIRNDSREVAVNTIRWHMLYHHIAEQEGIEVSSSDTEKLVKSLAADYKTTYEQAKQTLEQSGRISSIKDTLLEEKVLDFLIVRAKVVSKEAGR